jgi:26S proteasome regulatory subunit T1
MGKDE